MSRPLTVVSVVVPTRNRAELLRDCIESLIRQDFPSDQYEVIVVDDGSTDDTAEVVRLLSDAHPSPAIRSISLPRVGVNGARNQGIRNSMGEIICIVDDDELVQDSHLKAVVENLQQDPNLDAVGGPYRPYARSRIRTCARCVPGAADLPGTGKRKVNQLFGGNMAIRKKVFQSRGMFDEELSGFNDEVEWFRRRPLLDLLYDPDLWVWHRRDRQTLLELCRSAWNQGLAIPPSNAKMGIRESPSITRLLRYIGHGIVRNCGVGFVLACREAGALRAARASTD